ncbi:DUF3267 domain-containing protein [uncultured Draconibacterium sp.]|uniref:DUF3267 domain-containing protein n=1 Tax=uncultured Draconibacterium sp. TaxID=1573823 RepID=UPI003260ED65
MTRNNPTIDELKNSDQYEQVAELHHSNIKEFVIDQTLNGGKLVKRYMIYQLVMITLGTAIFSFSVFLAFKSNPAPLYWCLAALLFCFSILVVFHELLHGIAIKYTGAPIVNYGAYFKKFIFYAEADQFVMNRQQFTLIALAPLVVVKFITFIGILLTFGHPAIYGIAFVMCAHSLFCAGDVALLSIFYREKFADIYTFDIRAEKKTYYYKKLKR